MACPFFMPTSKFDDGGWIHPSRLPLGGGWRGQCSAPGHAGEAPSEEELQQFCNLGYPSGCSRLPQERSSDAVRFGVAQDRGDRLAVEFVFENKHLPSGHGTLDYDVRSQTWLSTHPDPCIQKMAQCYLESYLQRRTRPVTGPEASTKE